MRLATASCVVVAASACVSCTAQQVESEHAVVLAASSASPIPLPQLPALQAADECTTSPVFGELPLTPEDEFARWLAYSLRLCSRAVSDAGDGSPRFQLEVINAGPGLWVLDGVPRWDEEARTQESLPLAVKVFRNKVFASSGLAIEPGEKAYVIVPEGFPVRLHLDRELQVAWEITKRGVDATQSRLRGALLNQLSSELRPAAECGLSAVAVAKNVESVNRESSPDEIVELIYAGAVEAADCRTAIDEAKVASERARRVAPLAAADLTVTAIHDQTAINRSGSALKAALLRVGKFFH